MTRCERFGLSLACTQSCTCAQLRHAHGLGFQEHIETFWSHIWTSHFVDLFVNFFLFTTYLPPLVSPSEATSILSICCWLATLQWPRDCIQSILPFPVDVTQWVFCHKASPLLLLICSHLLNKFLFLNIWKTLAVFRILKKLIFNNFASVFIVLSEEQISKFCSFNTIFPTILQI